jgi:hypothetical protein
MRKSSQYDQYEMRFFFTGSITAAMATNKGQFRNKFQVVIAGSNSYTNPVYLVSQARDESAWLLSIPYKAIHERLKCTIERK